MSDFLEIILKYQNWIMGIFFGLITGSFYTALASRILYYYYGPGRKIHGWYIKYLLSNRWKQILTRPSFCFHCKNSIRGIYLLPLTGFIASKGRCSVCKNKIGYWTLAGEIYPAILLPILLSTGASWFLSILMIIFTGHLYIAIVTDTALYQLDHENTICLAILSTLIAWLETKGSWVLLSNHVFTGLGCLILFTILYLIYKRGLGMADIFMVTIIGFSLGLPFALLAIQIAAIFSILFIYIVIKDSRAPAPLGTGLALGWLLSMPLSYLWQWYA